MRAQERESAPMRRIVAVAVLAFTFAAGGAVRAGIADSPLPELLPGAKTVHLYSVPGVISGGGNEAGAARILATRKKIAGTSFVADRLSNPPTTSWQLTIIAKLKQKGGQLTFQRTARMTNHVGIVANLTESPENHL